jgi:gluconate 5-dehydrogenase
VAGARLILNGRNEQKLANAAKSFAESGHKIETRPFDVADEGAVIAAFEHFDAAGVEIDILVNNAGIQFRKPMVELTTDEMSCKVEINLHRRIPGRRGRRRDGSRAARRQDHQHARSRRGRAAIAPARARAASGRRPLDGGDGRKLMHPGYRGRPRYIATEMNRAVDPKLTLRQGRTPSGRWGKPEDLIGVAVFLASPASDYVNGQIIYVDGGLLAVI